MIGSLGEESIFPIIKLIGKLLERLPPLIGHKFLSVLILSRQNSKPYSLINLSKYQKQRLMISLVYWLEIFLEVKR
jgi:hypothetical protein